MKIIVLFAGVAISLLSGCASFHPTIPNDYVGDTATIKDSAKRIDSGKVDIFYLSHIDGKLIRNSMNESLGESRGRGNNLHLVLLNNRVPSEKRVFSIVGQTLYAMPIRSIMGKNYEIKGDVEFYPLPDEAYVIKGNLSEGFSEIWVEKISDGEVVDKIEIRE